MDPNAAWRELIYLIIEGTDEDKDQVLELVEALDKWVRDGGFMPILTEDEQRVVFNAAMHYLRLRHSV